MITRQNIGGLIFIVFAVLLLTFISLPLAAQSFSDHHFLPFRPEQFPLLARGDQPVALNQRIESCKSARWDSSADSTQHDDGNATFLPEGPLPVLEWARERPETCVKSLDQPLESLNQINTCPSSSIFDPIILCGISQRYLVRPSPDEMFFSGFNRYPILSAPAAAPSESFGWRPALVQSFKFLLVEHGFRLATDPGARDLLLHKPFWHDYLASGNHFVMSRWGDGDDFIVNYIGHPMEGAVTGDIEIQNDPRGRSVKFGKSSAYWKSRLRAMSWAAVYSMYFEIGPVLSEAAIGNEGGYTYVPGCELAPCNKPGHFKPPTNNTGWVDFTVTPLVGLGWIVLEDSIEAELIDRVVKDDDPAFKYKVLLAALSPSRSMANMLAGKYPWYRYNEQDEGNSVSALMPTDQKHPWEEGLRRDVGIHYTNINLPMDWEGCNGCRVNNSGAGFNFGYRLSHIFAVDSELNYFPGSGGSHGKGSIQEGLVGFKIGHPLRSWGLYGEVRPGIIHYDKALLTEQLVNYQSVTRFVVDVGGVVEYYPSRHGTLRFDMGTTFVRYLTGRADPHQPPVSVLSEDYIATQGNFHISSGYTYRF